MSVRKRKLHLHASLNRVEGCGDEVTFVVGGHRATKTGGDEFYELHLKVCRWGVKQVLRQLHAMHGRDRARITAELKRIDQEVATLASGDEQ